MALEQKTGLLPAVFISTELYIVVLTCLVQKYYFLNYKGRKFTYEKLPEKCIPACISNAKRRERKTLPVCPLSRGELFFFLYYFFKRYFWFRLPGFFFLFFPQSAPACVYNYYQFVRIMGPSIIWS